MFLIQYNSCAWFVALICTFCLEHGDTRFQPECNMQFNVWEPDADMSMRMRNLELKYANFSNYVDKEILQLQVRALADTQRNQNWTLRLERSLTEIKIGQLQKLSEIKDIRVDTEEYESKLTKLGEKFDDVVLHYSEQRPQRRKHVRYDRMLPSRGSQSDNPGNYVLETLKNMVSDLKSEWILMKRDLIEIRTESLELKRGQSELYNNSINFKSTTDYIQDTCNKVKNTERKTSNDITNVKSDVERIKQDLSGIKSTQESLRNDVLVTENSVTKIEASTVDIKREIIDLQTENDYLRKMLSQTPRTISDHRRQLRLTTSELKSEQGLHSQIVPKDCADIVAMGYSTSGVYQVKPSKTLPLDNMYCEIMNQTGYTVIQRRTDGLQNFNRRWLEYMIGFGNLYGEFWAGNEVIHALTKDKHYSLRVDLWDWEGNRTYAEYNSFSVGDKESKYALHVSGYSGNAGDSLSFHNGMKFSTEDHDNDLHMRNCAEENKGGWWYSSCYFSQLNGVYHVGWYSQTHADGIVWYTLKDSERYSLRRVEMKLKRRMSKKDKTVYN